MKPKVLKLKPEVKLKRKLEMILSVALDKESPMKERLDYIRVMALIALERAEK